MYESAARANQHWNSTVGKFVGGLYHCLSANHLFLDIEAIFLYFFNFSWFLLINDVIHNIY